MFLSHIYMSPARGKALLSGTFGMRFQGWSLTHPFSFGCCSPLSNARGRVAYWLIAVLVLLAIFSTVAIFYLKSGESSNRVQPIISPDQKEVSKPPQRYKIPMPARESVQVAPGSSSDTVAHEAPVENYSKLPLETIGSQATTPLEKSVKNVRLGSPAGAVDQQNVFPPPETEKRRVKVVEKESSIATRQDVDRKLSADEKVEAQGIAAGPDVTSKTEKGSSHKVGKASLQAGAETGKRLFVKVHVGNVREAPSMTSRVKFRLEMGDLVTVTGNRRGWVSVKLDNGRFGWVYHTLLTDSIVPQEAMAMATREIKAIRPEVAAKDVAKVIFELNGPFPLQTMIVEGEKPRVVCDFFDAGLASEIGDIIEVNDGIVEKIRTGLHKWPKSKVRVVLDLVPGRNYEVDKIFLDKQNYYVLVVKAKE